MSRLQLNELRPSFFSKTCLSRSVGKDTRRWEERKKRNQLECEDSERGRHSEAEWDKNEREGVILSEKGRGVYHPLMAPAESGARVLSPASVTVETAAHISTSPGESKSPPGENKGREIRETKKQSISSPVPFCCQTQKSKEEEEEKKTGRGLQ